MAQRSGGLDFKPADFRELTEKAHNFGRLYRMVTVRDNRQGAAGIAAVQYFAALEHFRRCSGFGLIQNRAFEHGIGQTRLPGPFLN